MSYLRDGVEYLTADENAVYEAVKSLNKAARTTNNSQVAQATGFSPSKVGDLAQGLRRRGYLKDVSKGAAYHWRTTSKPAAVFVAAPVATSEDRQEGPFADALRAEIERVKKDSFVEGYQAADEEAMGLILSHFTRWDGLAILRAAQYGLEDANFHTESAIVGRMAEHVEAGEPQPEAGVTA